MTELILDTGELVTNKHLIVEEITKFYSKLYKLEEGFESEQTKALNDMMSYVTEIVTPNN